MTPRSELEMGITLKFTETNLFLIKMDYFYIGNLYFFNWDVLHARLNTRYKALSYKKKKYKKIKA